MKKHRQHASHKKGHKRPPSNNSPEMAVLIVTGVSEDGYVTATPQEWNDRRNPPHIIVNDARPGGELAKGDRILARMSRAGPHVFQAQVIRVLPEETAKRVIGIFMPSRSGGGVIEPVSHKHKESYAVSAEDTNGALAGELVSGTVTPGRRLHGMEHARIEQRLGSHDAPHAASLIAANIYRLPSVFSSAALAEAARAPAPVHEAGREDLRSIPLVTIDGEDARDFDDAVFAEPDKDPANPGGFHLIVAIADVAYYVKPESALDKEAFERGNSVYFPDRVIPMLPEHLSNGLCSLKPNEDRYCLAVHIWIDAGGITKRYQFTRAFMRSHARLTYTQVESSHDNPLVANLLAAYKALCKERDARGTLEIQLPEYKVMFDAAGNISHIAPRTQLESHRLIEAFMVAANVAAANYLLSHQAPGMYRVHEPPSEEKVLNLRKFLSISGYSLPKGSLSPAQLNRVLHQSEKRPNTVLIHTVVLRSQMQAFYSNKNLGHYGLGLKQYCHFTSPIRRYSDLIVHRSLAALIAKEKPAAAAPESLSAVALHISETERLAMAAERDAMDRYRVSYMTRHVGEAFTGTITGVNEYGIYVTLADNGITGFVPVRQLGREFFIYNKTLACFQARSGKGRFGLGDAIVIRVVEANASRNNLIFTPEESQAPQHTKKKPGKSRDHKKPFRAGKKKKAKQQP